MAIVSKGKLFFVPGDVVGLLKSVASHLPHLISSILQNAALRQKLSGDDSTPERQPQK